MRKNTTKIRALQTRDIRNKTMTGETVFKYLDDQNMAMIANRLQVPLVIGDILNDQEDLSDDTYRALHDILSEDQPDSALLSIALSAYILANRHVGKAACFSLLKIECERIIAEYGMLWLRNAQAKTLDDNMVFETLVHIPEDLTCLAELLEFAGILLNTENSDAAEICDILVTQAHAQAIIAETFLEAITFNDDDCDEDSEYDLAPWDMDGEFESELDSAMADQIIQIAAMGDNIIPFPAGSIR